MPGLKVTIARFVDDHQPGFVECTFLDASGTTHSIIEKVPVISAEHLWSDSENPRAGEIECTVRERFRNSLGDDLARIDTELPDHIESTRGETEFVVFCSQIADRKWLGYLTSNSAVAPDANRCFTVLREPCFIASRFAPVNRKTLDGRMTDPTPTIGSLDGSIFMSLVSVKRADDPRMDEATFKLAGPNLTAESTIDAYLIDTLFDQVRGIAAGDTVAATFGLSELTFRRSDGSDIRVELSGGPYVGGAQRAWACSFVAANHQVAAFCEALEEAWRTTPAV